MPLQKVPHSSNILQTCNLQPTAKELSIFQFGPPPIICQRETNGCDIYMDLHICPTREGVEQLKHHYLQLELVLNCRCSREIKGWTHRILYHGYVLQQPT